MLLKCFIMIYCQNVMIRYVKIKKLKYNLRSDSIKNVYPLKKYTFCMHILFIRTRVYATITNKTNK